MPKILYNVTINVDLSVIPAWKQWMKDIHIPEVMATGCFEDFRFCKVITDQDQGGETFAVQYLAKNKATYDKYIAEHAPELRNRVEQAFGGKFAAFRTILELID